MKIALVHSYYSSRQSSGENVVVDAQAAALSEHGFNVRVVSAHTDDLENRRNYKMRSAFTVATGRGASPLAELEDFAPDIVHVHNLFPNWGTGWLDKWDGPLVATIHNFRPVCAAGTLFRDGEVCTLCPDRSSREAVKFGCYRGSKVASLPLAVRNRKGLGGDRLLSRADRVVLLSERTRSLYKGFGLPDEKIEVIPNFVDGIGFSPEVSPGAEWVYIGRLSGEKGILNLLQHWPEHEILNVYGDGPLRAEIEAATRPNVRYCGLLDHRNVASVLAASRGLVFPSETPEGGIPLSYVEALAAGRVVVAKVGNSASDDVQKSGAGSVFGSWNELPVALAQASATAVPSGRDARRHFEANFQRGTFLARTTSLYHALLNRPLAVDA
jgi:glycosyltransferase involved in cell wall biosynthesis